MNKDYNEIIDELKNGKVHPVYFLSGEEPYFIDSISNYISNNILSESEKDFNQTIFYGKDSQPSQVIEACLRFPMMAQYNLILLKEAQEMKNIAELDSYVKNANPTTILVICHKHKKVDKRTKFYKTLKDSAVVFEGKKIYENKVAQWVKSYLEEKNYTIDNKATYILSEYLGNDLNKISNELNKLFIVIGENQHISLEDIEKNIGISKDYNLFELQKALAKRDAAKCAKIYNYIEGNPKNSPIQLTIGMLFNFFSKATVLQYNGKDPKITGKEIGIQTWMLEDYLTAMRNFPNKLPSVISLLREYDLKSKGLGSNNTDPVELSKEMIFRILSV
jgi:DNA polymerase-3 subunit delta